MSFQPLVDGVELPQVLFTDVWLVPDLAHDLFASFHVAKHKGIDIDVRGNIRRFHREGKTLSTATADDGEDIASLDGHVVPNKTSAAQALSATRCKVSLDTLHRRLGHPSYDNVERMVDDDLVEGVELADRTRPSHCDPCLVGKLPRASFPSSTSRATAPLEVVVSDVHEMPVRSLAGYKYFVTFVDDYSRFAHVALLKGKTSPEILAAFKKYQARYENWTEKRIKLLRTDGGGEYTSNEFATYRDEKGIVYQHTVPHTPEQNGIAERLNRTIEERVIAMLQDAGLGKVYWAEAVNCYMAVHNAIPTSAVPGMTPHQRFLGKKPDLSRHKVFGSRAYVHVPKVHRKHLDHHARLCRFVGYEEGVKGWRFVDEKSHKVIVSHSATFVEHEPGQAGHLAPKEPISWAPFMVPAPSYPGPSSDGPGAGPSYVSPAVSFGQSDDHEIPVADQPSSGSEPASPLATSSLASDGSVEDGDHSGGDDDDDDDATAPAAAPATTLPSNISFKGQPFVIEIPLWQPPQQQQQGQSGLSGSEGHSPHQAASALLVQQSRTRTLPQSYQEAVDSPDAHHWIAAMVTEMLACHEAGTWTIDDLPRGRKTVKQRWVFSTKENADGTIERYKARIVAKGFTQRPGIDVHDTFAPVARAASIRTILHTAAVKDWELDQIDISTAFLNGDLDEEIFMEQPDGFVEGAPGQVCRLRKSLYGLKQSPRQ